MVVDYLVEGLLLHLDAPWTAQSWERPPEGCPLGKGPVAPWSALADCLQQGTCLRSARVGGLLQARGWWGLVHFSEDTVGEVDAVQQLVAAKARVAAWVVGTCCSHI